MSLIMSKGELGGRNRSKLQNSRVQMLTDSHSIIKLATYSRSTLNMSPKKYPQSREAHITQSTTLLCFDSPFTTSFSVANARVRVSFTLSSSTMLQPSSSRSLTYSISTLISSHSHIYPCPELYNVSVSKPSKRPRSF